MFCGFWSAREVCYLAASMVIRVRGYLYRQ